MKKKWTCLLLGGVLAFSLGGCRNGENNEMQHSGGGSNSVRTDSEGGETESGDVDIYNTLAMVYPVNQYSSMVLAELQSVGEVLLDDNTGWGIKCLMTEFKIVEDYYQKIPQNTIVQVPVMPNGIEKDMQKQENLDKIMQDSVTSDSSGTEGNGGEELGTERLSGFLKEHKQFILFIDRVYESQKWYRSKNREDWVEYSSVASRLSMPIELIPLSNNVVKLNHMLNFLDENHCHYSSPNSNIYKFSSFIWDEMTMEKAAENIRGLYQAQLDGTADTPPKSTEGIDY